MAKRYPTHIGYFMFAKQPKNKGDPAEEMPEEDRNLIGFFELLFEVDRRINPQLYISPNQENSD